MNYTNLGNHKVKVSKIGLGSLFNNYKIKDNVKIKKIINRAYDLGINIIDTAPVYGSGAIERTIGFAIKGKRKEFIIATKNLPSQNKYEEIISSADESLKRLKTDYIDLFQIHWPNHNITIEETCEALKNLLKKGKIKYVGVCNSTLNDLKKYRQILDDKLVSIQNEFNLFERSYDNNFKKFIENKNITIIAYAPFNNGKFYNGLNQKRILDNLEKKYGRKKSEIILNWISSQSKNIVSIPSTLKIKNLISNAQSQKFNLSMIDRNTISKKCKTLKQYISPSEIYVEKSASSIYHSLADAKKNLINLNPSPKSLAQEIIEKNLLKPIKVKLISKRGKKKYLLDDGILRYWSWQIAYGKDKKIPSLVYVK